MCMDARLLTGLPTDSKRAANRLIKSWRRTGAHPNLQSKRSWSMRSMRNLIISTALMWGIPMAVLICELLREHGGHLTVWSGVGATLLALLAGLCVAYPLSENLAKRTKLFDDD